MVFRGIPSKACGRCRNRKLRCDQQRPSCSSCIRVGVPCAGYQDTTAIRISDQTDSVRAKAMMRSNVGQNKRNASSATVKIRHMSQDLRITGRDMFFTYYVSDFCHTWDFLYQYLDSPVAPEHITLGIEAVSLAFLSHQVSSQTAKDLGRRKYCEALRKINATLQDAHAAKAMSTFEGALLLDLFEKMTKSVSELNVSRHAHVDGAVAIVKLRGVESFKEGAKVRALMGLNLNATICSLSTGRAIDNTIRQIREHASQYVDTDHPKWKLTGLMLEVTDLIADMRKGTLTPEEWVARSIDKDQKLEMVALEADAAWRYERKLFPANHTPKLVPDDSFLLYDVYPDRMTTQMCNFLRLTRILLCEEIIESYATSNIVGSETQYRHAELAILKMIHEICASVPQMTDCGFAAKHRLPEGSTEKNHTHTMSHILDVYVLIFGLYVVAWSHTCPRRIHHWAIVELQHIADHFHIKEAAIILDVLKEQQPKARSDTWSPFRVYDAVILWKRTPVLSGPLDLPTWMNDTQQNTTK